MAVHSSLLILLHILLFHNPDTEFSGTDFNDRNGQFNTKLKNIIPNAGTLLVDLSSEMTYCLGEPTILTVRLSKLGNSTPNGFE